MNNTPPLSDTEFLALAEDLVEADSGSLSLDDALVDIGWDSLANVEFIADADARTSVVINAQHLADSRTLRDVRDLLTPRK